MRKTAMGFGACFLGAIFWGEAIRRAAVVGAQKAVFHVSPEGDDAGVGSAAKPFATLARARDAVRAAKAEGPLTAGAEVVLHGGRYVFSQTVTLTEADVGLSGAPVVYAAAKGEGVFLTGAQGIPASAFKPISDGRARGRLVADPGFVNYGTRDFRLKPDSAVFTRIPGFQPLPLEKMGLRPHHRREGTSSAER